jgi:L-threonylcarbamoyladenylate synthase
MIADLDPLAAILRRGGVVLLPTDTIYGLHGVAINEDAIARIVAIKARDGSKPFVVLGSSKAQLESIGARFDRSSEIVDELWPGPLTAIVGLEKPVAASRGTSSLAVRVPALAWLRDLIEMTGPLASTSANLSGEPPLITPHQLSNELLAAIDEIVDAGPLDGKPSTIVDFTHAEPRLIREGEAFFTQKVWKTLRKSL